MALRASPDEEIVLDFPARSRSLRHARSTVLLASIAAVRATARWERYLAALPQRHQAVLFESIAGAWIPIDSACAHYAACDAAGFSPEQAYANGRATYAHAGSSIYGTFSKMAREAGVTPWALLCQLQRFWDRGYDGGALRVARLGPKEARVDVAHVSLLESVYYRNALRGVLMSAVDLFCRKGYAREIGRRSFGVSFRVQWA